MNCRSCESSVEFLLDFGEQPIVNNLQDKPGITPKFSIKVGGCTNCGLVQILNPIDPAEFYTNYANSSSAKREPHLEKLIEKLESLLPKSAKIIDVGCNDGKFLGCLRERGFRNLFGVEPTWNMSMKANAAGFKIFHAYLNGQKSEEIVSETGKFDCVVIRQVLEHIEDLSDIGAAFKKLLKPDGVLVIEIPDSEAWFTGCDYSIWQEHIEYFDLKSLQHFLAQHELSIFEFYRSVFAGMTLTVFATPASSKKLMQNRNAGTIRSFRAWAANFAQFKKSVHEEIQTFIDNKSEIILFGVGARSSSFLNFTGVVRKISFAIDDDPIKQGKYLPGTSIEIVSREIGFEKIDENSLVLLGVNGENEKKLLDEITPLKNCIFRSILPPSRYLLSAFMR